jgi:hypothetical protein
MSRLLAVRARAVGRFAGAVVRREPGSAALVAAGTVLTAFYVARLAARPHGAATVLGVALLLVVLGHGARRDARFLLLCGLSPRREFALEYALLVIPAAGLLLASAAPALALALPVAAASVAALPPGWLSDATMRRAAVHGRLRLAPRRDFEWVSGSRRALPALILCYLLALLFSAIPMMVVVTLVLLTWTVCAFYGDAEGRSMLRVFAARPGPFLRIKVGRALAQWALWTTPVSILLLTRHSDLWPLLLAALLGNALVLVGAVLAKYAAYQEGRAGGAAAVIAPALLTLSLLMPPVTIFALVRLWRAASHHLASHLGTHD